MLYPLTRLMALLGSTHVNVPRWVWVYSKDPFMGWHTLLWLRRCLSDPDLLYCPQIIDTQTELDETLIQSADLFGRRRVHLLYCARPIKKKEQIHMEQFTRDLSDYIFIQSPPLSQTEQKHAIYSYILKHGWVVPIGTLNFSDERQWTQAWAKALGLSLSANMLHTITQFHQGHPMATHHLLMHLASFRDLPASKQETYAHMLLSPNAQTHSYALVDAIAAQDGEKIVEIMGRLRRMHQPLWFAFLALRTALLEMHELLPAPGSSSSKFQKRKTLLKEHYQRFEPSKIQSFEKKIPYLEHLCKKDDDASWLVLTHAALCLAGRPHLYSLEPFQTEDLL